MLTNFEHFFRHIFYYVTVAHKAFPSSQPVLDLVKDLINASEVSARDVEYNRAKISSFLRGLKVSYEIPGHPGSRRTMGVNDLGRNAHDASFEASDGTTTNVVNYFAREKRYKIRYPDLPLLWVGSKNKLILIPMEVNFTIRNFLHKCLLLFFCTIIHL